MISEIIGLSLIIGAIPIMAMVHQIIEYRKETKNGKDH